MRNLSTSEWYAAAAAIALLFAVMLNNSVVTLVVGAAGFLFGLWLARRGDLRRAALFAIAAFAVSAALALFTLLR